MQDIHDIIPPVQVGFDPMLLKIILMVLAGLFCLILLFFLIKKFWKKKSQSQGLKYLPEPDPPGEAALKQLELLAQTTVFNPRIFYFDLTAILRNYIGRSFNINAIEMTSQEFIKNINLLDIEKKIKQNISQFIKSSDFFKYAGTIAVKEKADTDFVLIKESVVAIEKALVKQIEKAKSIEKVEQKQNQNHKQNRRGKQ